MVKPTETDKHVFDLQIKVMKQPWRKQGNRKKHISETTQMLVCLSIC